MLHIVYNLLITLTWPALLLYYRLRASTDGKYRKSHRYRLGLAFPPARSVTGRRVWLHALSVGEVLSVAPLVHKLKTTCSDVDIVFSTATETGRSVAEQQLGLWVSTFFFLPHDFPWAVRGLIRRVDPDLFILVETDIWPNLLSALKRRRVSTVLVNGRISHTSFLKYRRLRPLMKDVFAWFDLVFVQSADDRERYVVLGAPEGRVHAVGNLKFDSAVERPSREQIEVVRKAAGIGEGRTVWIAGSTHQGEEEILLRVHKAILEEIPDALLILAPRQVHRASQVLDLCRSQGFAAVTRSSNQRAEGKSLFLLDTLGELKTFYGLGDGVFIGGSLVPFGGHNPLEAVALRKPACWGPYLSNFREMEAELISAGCGWVVASEEELRSMLLGWLKDPAIRHRMEHATGSFMESHSGCSQRIARYLTEELSRTGGRCRPHH